CATPIQFWDACGFGDWVLAAPGLCEDKRAFVRTSGPFQGKACIAGLTKGSMDVASVEALGLSEALGITFEEVDRAGVVTLSRPTRLNALNRETFEALSAQYREWAPNPQIYGVVMQSA